MTTPPDPPPQRTLSPHLPVTWSGGALEYLFPDHQEWFLESWAPPEWVAVMATWEPLEPLTQGDPPEVWGAIDLGGGGAGAAPRQTEPRSGAVLRISATGVILDDFDQWLNTSRFHPTVDLAGVRVGDICLAQVELSREGRAYLTSLTVLPLDEPHAPAQAGETPGAPETEHMTPEGGER
jgi:hypothetical protein